MGKAWIGQEVDAIKVDLEFKALNIQGTKIKPLLIQQQGVNAKPTPNNLNLKPGTG